MKKLKRLFKLVIIVAIVGIAIILITNFIMINEVKENIISEEKASTLTNVDSVLVLGCGVDENGNPSKMLADRVAVGIRVYKSNSTNRILMSGDHGRKDYDEVNTMKSIALKNGIDEDSVFCDHAGFSTYETMYRATDIFGIDKVIIVTQKYHLYRALYDAKKMGIEAYGVASDEREYGGQLYRDVRELLARTKDFVWCIIKPEPTYRGEKIPIETSGTRTNG